MKQFDMEEWSRWARTSLVQTIGMEGSVRGGVGFDTNGCTSVSCLSRRQESPAINRFGYFALCSDKSLKSNVREGRFALVHSVKVQ